MTPAELENHTRVYTGSPRFTKQRIIAMDAKTCAEFMEENCIQEVTFIGPFSSADLYEPGQRVRIKKGARARTTHPAYSDGKEYKRATVVTVKGINTGWVDRYYPREPVIRNPEVVFAGSGGYWVCVDMNDVELVE